MAPPRKSSGPASSKVGKKGGKVDGKGPSKLGGDVLMGGESLSDGGNTTDVSRAVPPPGKALLEHSAYECSSTSDEENTEAREGGSKVAKIGSPRATRLARSDLVTSPRLSDGRRKRAVSGRTGDSETDGATALGAAVGAVSAKVPQKSGGLGGAASSVAQLKAVTKSLLGVVLDARLDSGVSKGVMEHAHRFEELFITLLTENERLRGRLDVLQVAGTSPIVPASKARKAVPPPPPPGSSGLRPPVETWSVVVSGKGASTTKEVASKVVEEVGPTLAGVRVHEVKATRDGRAIIRTPSVAERDRIASNPKFREVGLDVAVNDKIGPKVIVRGVHSEITPDEFMGDLYEMNLKGIMTPEAFRKGMRLASRPWKAGSGVVSVMLEGSATACDALLSVGRVYCKWFSFKVYSLDPIMACFRCMGFDHRARDCRSAKDLCYRCGQEGHSAARCGNAAHCRNCHFKGLDADHRLMSALCPIYSALIARANARH